MNVFFVESSMEDSYIYKTFNASNSLVERLVKYLKTSTVLTTEYFEEQYFQMKKVPFSPLYKGVLKAYDEGRIEILYSKEKVTNAVPFIVRRNEQGKVVATIFISSYTAIDKNDNLTIPVKQLYALMESAYVALEMQINPMKIQRNAGLMKICASVYSQMFTRIFNKEYALTLDKALFDKVNYVITRFFLEHVWEYPNEGLIDSYASSGLNFVDLNDLDLVKIGYNSAKINNIDDMIKYLKTLSPRMDNLNIRYFIERYITTYHGSSILSIDYLPYVFFIIMNILLGSFLISQTALGDLIKNTSGMNKFYSELAKTLGV